MCCRTGPCRRTPAGYCRTHSSRRPVCIRRSQCRWSPSRRCHRRCSPPSPPGRRSFHRHRSYRQYNRRSCSTSCRHRYSLSCRLGRCRYPRHTSCHPYNRRPRSSCRPGCRSCWPSRSRSRPGRSSCPQCSFPRTGKRVRTCRSETSCSAPRRLRPHCSPHCSADRYRSRWYRLCRPSRDYPRQSARPSHHRGRCRLPASHIFHRHRSHSGRRWCRCHSGWGWWPD